MSAPFLTHLEPEFCCLQPILGAVGEQAQCHEDSWDQGHDRTPKRVYPTPVAKEAKAPTTSFWGNPEQEFPRPLLKRT